MGAGATNSSETVTSLLQRATVRLSNAGVPSARVDAELLLAHAARAERSEIARAAILGQDLASLTGAQGGHAPAVLRTFDEMIARRSSREPLQHITGKAPFRHLELLVGPGVFVPRPETEVVAEEAIAEAQACMRAHGSAVVVDLCTGSGAIALAIAAEVPGARVHAVELDEAAHEWAARNIAHLAEQLRDAQSGAPEVVLTRGDARRALVELDGICDVVVSNPPYVPRGAVPREEEVALHDPAVALYGLGADGLEVPRGIVSAAARLLRPGGLFVMEHAEVQADAVRQIVSASGTFEQVTTRSDLTDRPRMVVARRARHGNDHRGDDPLLRPNVGDSKP